MDNLSTKFKALIGLSLFTVWLGAVSMRFGESRISTEEEMKTLPISHFSGMPLGMFKTIMINIGGE